MLYKFLENGKTNTIWRDFDRLNEALTRSFLEQDPVRPNSYPPLNVYTKEDDAFVYAFLPGMTIEDIDLSAKDNVLVIRGTKKEEALAENTEVYLREIFNGDFSRSVEFPFRIDADKVTASYKNGVLGILVPRAEEDKPKKIAIKIANQ
ncbi:Hsp20/alpha crystallin family protein [Leptospira sp. GIMC2001]|uniref:Hsp20/alpha crystallin family protein n=1 Tax=Leptospira sp. GIMC2001 TaxID=1513297 RepID=UPI0023499821|nr:Hsp20/alpha crystallin family protein [Leptospira sp. GIMC2001]WCL50963.1 Hsp20/alpha crystallin family protein [Leptospira sp. GIMC2001]